MSVLFFNSFRCVSLSFASPPVCRLCVSTSALLVGKKAEPAVAFAALN